LVRTLSPTPSGVFPDRTISTLCRRAPRVYTLIGNIEVVTDLKPIAHDQRIGMFSRQRGWPVCASLRHEHDFGFGASR